MHAGMDITPLVSPQSQVVQGYYPGGFRISGVRLDGPVIVLPDRLAVWDGRIELSAFQDLEGVELLLIGTGDNFQLMPPKLKVELRQRGISCETMDTRAACRTFHVLLTEGRNIAAALTPIGSG